MTVDTQWSVIAWGQIEGSRDHGAHMRVPQETWIGRGGKERKRGLERRGWNTRPDLDHVKIPKARESSTVMHNKQSRRDCETKAPSHVGNANKGYYS